MMRKNLAKMNGERRRFIGTFKRYGTKSGWNGTPINTVLLTNILDSYGVEVADHLWFTMTIGFGNLGELKEGDKIGFDARVKEYEKGYVNDRECIDDRKIDYRLSHPTKIRRI